jgi:hypothetical protein
VSEAPTNGPNTKVDGVFRGDRGHEFGCILARSRLYERNQHSKTRRILLRHADLAAIPSDLSDLKPIRKLKASGRNH